eukprot:COSAG01_NODE_713_length_14097_cov_15.136448_13_plen_118_part_00
MPNLSKKKGNEGEKNAIKYLKESDYAIRSINFHSYFGEIDIIAEKNQQIHFIEVKNYKKNSLINPLYMIGYTKQQKIIKTAKFYLLRHPYLDKNYQFDIILIQNKELKEHIENAFQC